MAIPILRAIYQGLIFTLAAYFANSVPVYMSGFGRIDRGKKFYDGKALLGSHKSIGGLLGGTLGGGMVGISAPMFFPEIFNMVEGYQWWIGLVMGFGTVLGDAIGSFFKRRSNVKPGGPFPVMDQTGFIIAALLLADIFVNFPIEWYWIIPVTLLIHLGANSFAYVMGWKDVPW